MGRLKLDEMTLMKVNGGVSINNNWGDHTVYKIGKNKGEYTHTFSAADYDQVEAIVDAVYDTSLTKEENDDNIMAALLAEPGLLSPL